MASTKRLKWSAPIDDEPVFDIRDLADRRLLAEQLAEAIERCKPPQVIGVHGDWGSGKTSFLRYLRSLFDGKTPDGSDVEDSTGVRDASSHVRTIWFDAWRHQNEPAPLIALLHEMRAQRDPSVVDQLGETITPTIKAALLALESLTAKFSLKLWGTGVEFSAAAPKFSLGLAAHRASTLSTPLPAEVLLKELRSVLNQLLPKPEYRSPLPRFVIFIDDLDRCDPTSAFHLLEAIKVYLNLDNCVFVLGLNRREIARAIASALPARSGDDGDRGELLVRAHEYTEKLCGHFIGLPHLNTAEQQHLVEKWLYDLGARKLVDEIKNLIAQHHFLPANARRIKAWCNAMRRLIQHRTSGSRSPASIDGSEAACLAILASLHQFHPDLFQVLESDFGFYKLLRIFATNGDGLMLRPDGSPRNPPHPLFAPLRLRRGTVLREPIAPELLGKSTTDDTGKAHSAVPSDAQLFADANSVNVLHCQTLLAATEMSKSEWKQYFSE